MLMQKGKEALQTISPKLRVIKHKGEPERESPGSR
jgi:hypothetical protein